MSYNPNFYNCFPSNTFQSFYPSNIPPPPIPPAFFIPSAPPSVKVSDHDIIKGFENQIKPVVNCKIKSFTISEVKDQIRVMLVQLNNIKENERILQENIQSLSDEEWNLKMKEIQKIKAEISNSLACINDNYLEVIKKLISKRSSKRMRQKRLRMERKTEKEERMKKLKERSRKIDENLQKIKDDYEKAKQEEESKLQADIVLKEVLRKKHDTKKYITKLEMLMKLRRARENTARGRGESVSEREREEFNNNIEKLKQIWLTRQAIYDEEESHLRGELKANSDKEACNESERVVQRNLGKWRRVMFGSSRGTPQVEFAGDVGRFVAVRSHWDQFLNANGTSIPVGWVTPSQTTWSFE